MTMTTMMIIMMTMSMAMMTMTPPTQADKVCQVTARAAGCDCCGNGSKGSDSCGVPDDTGNARIALHSRATSAN